MICASVYVSIPVASCSFSSMSEVLKVEVWIRAMASISSLESVSAMKPKAGLYPG